MHAHAACVLGDRMREERPGVLEEELDVLQRLEHGRHVGHELVDFLARDAVEIPAFVCLFMLQGSQ